MSLLRAFLGNVSEYLTPGKIACAVNSIVSPLLALNMADAEQLVSFATKVVLLVSALLTAIPLFFAARKAWRDARKQ